MTSDLLAFCRGSFLIVFVGFFNVLNIYNYIDFYFYKVLFYM